jgi:hypothetical protein
MNSNMEYRKYLTNNSNTIIKMNQTNVCQNNSDIFNLNYSIKTISTPVLLNSVKSPPLAYNSDLKKNYLDEYLKQSTMFTPGIMYNY